MLKYQVTMAMMVTREMIVMKKMIVMTEHATAKREKQ